MEGFDHLIEISAESRSVTIFRVGKDGDKILYTSVELPQCLIETEEGVEQFKKFAQMLGENILMDSSVVRGLYKL